MQTVDPQQTSYVKKAFQACRQAFYFVGIFSFFINILMLTVPIYMLQLFDRVLASRSFQTLFYLTLIAIIALMAFALLDMARSRILVRVTHWLDLYLSPAALAHSADEILQGRHYGAQSLRDISTIRQFLGGPSIFALFDSPWVPIYLLVIFLLHPLLGVLATLGAILLFVLALLNELMTHQPLAEANTMAVITQLQTDATIRNAEVIQSMGMMPNIVKKWFQQNGRALELQTIASNRASIILSTSKFLRLTLQLLMLGTGAYLVVQNEITPGVMIAGSILLSRALAPVEQAIGAWKQMLLAQQSHMRLQNHFKMTVNRSAGIALPTPKGHIELKNVYYVPPGSQKPTINNVSLSVESGEFIALIGPSAAGKSTLARLITGAWAPNAGSVRLDGASVYTWDRDHFGKHVGYLPQDVELFIGTVKENIARMAEAEDTAVIEAATLAGIHEMILKLPKGYDTPIGAGAYNLSGGQRQRVALARALYKKPRILILDEPNSNLDTEGELALLHALEAMHQEGSTIIIIAHRPTILKVADRIVVLNVGQIQFAGPREEILEKIQQLAHQSQKKINDNVDDSLIRRAE